MTTAGRFRPARVLSIDLEAPLVGLDRQEPGDDRFFEAAWCLLWRGDRPVGSALVDIPAEGLDAAGLRAALGPVAAAPPAALAPADTPPVTVVIATRDRPDQLERAVRSVLDVKYDDVEVLVVDSAPSTTASAELVAHMAATEPRLRYVATDRPGLALAHNIGLVEVTTPLVAFTDDDVIVDQRWLLGLAEGFAAPDVACVTGMIAPAELDTEIQWWIEAGAGFNKGFEPRVFDLGPNRPDDPLFPFTAGQLGSGANMAFRTEVLRELGGFDDALGAGSLARGGDDLAAFVSVLASGHRLTYAPAAVVFHHHHRSRDRYDAQSHGYGCGYSAFVTSTVIRHPMLLPSLVRSLPAGLRFALSPRSSKNAARPAAAPPGAKWRELAGVATGPVAYLRSRRAVRSRQ